MGFLKRLFGGGGGEPQDKDGMYFYVQSDMSDEVIQLRLHRFNDLSLTEDERGYFTRKMVVGQRSFDRIEVELSFDKNRRMVSGDVSGGKLVDRAVYEAYLAEKQADDPTG